MRPLVISIFFCFFSTIYPQNKLPKVKITEVFYADDLSVRALVIERNRVWYGSKNGLVGCYDFSTKMHEQIRINSGSNKPEFRMLTATKNKILALSAGSPALLFAINKHTKEALLVYQNQNQDIFFDGLHAINHRDIVAMGDPIEGQFTCIRSSDAGQTWQLINDDQLKASPGEAAFAASNSTLVARGKRIWFFSGGLVSRVFYSANKGKTWQSYALPCIQGEAMRGIFSADFFNQKIGIAVGGDYQNPAVNSGNKIMTTDGGKTWHRIADGKAFGYASCVRFAPGNKKQLFALTPVGLWCSVDKGMTWFKLVDLPELHVLSFANKHTLYAGGKGKLVKITLD